MTKEIELSKNKVALVDDDDFERLSPYRWHAWTKHHTFYALRNRRVSDGPGTFIIRMHRQIMNAPDNMEVDHINGDGLDNRKANLRLCTRSQNNMNKSLQRNNHSGIPGVGFHKASGKWRARIKINGKEIYLGVFSTIEGAIKARNEASGNCYGEFYKEFSL